MEQKTPEMVIQGTDEWKKSRMGKVTASRVADVVAKTKSGDSASRCNYMTQLVIERLTNKQEESYSNEYMDWGTEQEPFARAAYEAAQNVLVDEVGMITHPRIEMSGASPDGLVGDDGLVEIKCPKTATHIETLLSKTVPGKYNIQMHWQMICTGRQWCDFVSFDPRMPEGLRLFIKRVHKDASLAKSLEEEVIKFLTEVEIKLEHLNKQLEAK
jgi:putative phage-type endonuclease